MSGRMMFIYIYEYWMITSLHDCFCFNSIEISEFHAIIFNSNGNTVVDKTLHALSNATYFDTENAKVDLKIVEREIGRVSDVNIWSVTKSGELVI